MLNDPPSGRVTVIVEPDPDGHRYQAVAHVAEVAARSSRVVLLTTRGATAREEFSVYLDGAPLEAREVFDEVHPPTAQMLNAVIEQCRTATDSTVVVMDADATLKRWWFLAPRRLRALPHRPRVVFFLTRYPAQLTITDRTGWKLRSTKATLALAAMASGSLHHVAGFAGREDTQAGWLVKRARDPAICSASARDRDAIRQEFGLPADRRLVGIYGGISERKNAKLVFESMQLTGVDADLLLAGPVQPEVLAWIDSLGAADRSRVHVFNGFLSNEQLDKLVAAADVAPIALTNNGPSGIMGKALAAGVPVVSAGSTVRARELDATGGGEHAELEPASLGAAIKRVLTPGWQPASGRALPPATPEGFAQILLGTDVDGRPVRRSRFGR